MERSREAEPDQSVEYITTNAAAMGQPDYLPTAGLIAFAPAKADKLILVPLFRNTRTAPHSHAAANEAKRQSADRPAPYGFITAGDGLSTVLPASTALGI